MGYHLHPIIKRNLPQEPKIAELATGTGAFLVDLSKQLSSRATLDGYDISDVSYLPSTELPQNVSLNLVDAKQPAAAELRGKYDVVCIRFMNVALMPPDDWIAVATHAMQLLKPGGALQWIEGDFLQCVTVLQSEPETKTAALEKATPQTIGKLPHLNWFVSNLPEVLTTVGFTDVARNVMSSDRVAEDRRLISHVAFGAVYGILRHQAHSKLEGAPTEEEVESLMKEMGEEIDAGAYWRVDLHQFIAFKKA